MTTETKKTPFYKYHVDAGAKMVEFAGFIMPIQYSGITAEHLAVRKNVGLFDLSHMGEFEVTGEGAEAFLQKTTTNNVADLKTGQIQYSCMTYEDGGIVDDLLIYKLEDGYMLVVNASNLKKDYDWLSSHAGDDVTLTDLSDDFGLLAIQGPKAQKVMAELTDYDLDSMAYYNWAEAVIGDVAVMFSRTGYTGEDGFELYIPVEHCDKVWLVVSEAGKKHDLKMIGLAARDSLRLEMKMALYGNDIDKSTTPIEAGLSWIVDLNTDFIGKEVIAKQKEERPSRRLVCLELEGRAFPRTGYSIYSGDAEVGKVTSGIYSPSLEKPVALGYLPRKLAKSGSQVTVEIRNKHFPATVVKPPFYKNGTHK